MIDLKKYEVWFVTGSQHLYGDETLKKVNEHSQDIVKELNVSSLIPLKVVFKPVLTTPEAIYNLCLGHYMILMKFPMMLLEYFLGVNEFNHALVLSAKKF